MLPKSEVPDHTPHANAATGLGLLYLQCRLWSPKAMKGLNTQVRDWYGSIMFELDGLAPILL